MSVNSTRRFTRLSTTHWGTLALALAALAAGALVLSSPARGASAPTAQAVNYGLEWVRWIDPADLPPLEARPAICIVDTGQMTTPDLTDSGGHVLARIAIDGGSGEPLINNDNHMHGTYMAQYAIGDENDWGMTGIFPQGRIVSVRATTNSGAVSINYPVGMINCRQWALTNGVQIAAVNISVASAGSGGLALIENGIVQVQNQLGASVVAGAGNTPGPVLAPAAANGAFGVAAGGAAGELCSYASSGFGVDLVGPACGITDLDLFSGATYTSDGGGSSMAAAITSAAIAMLRTLKPSSTWQEAENWLTSTTRVVNGYPVLDGEAAARAAGLSAVVDRALARMATGDPPTISVPDTTNLLARPKGIVSWRRGRLAVSVKNRPTGATLIVTMIYRRGEFSERRITRRRTASRFKLASRSRPDRVLLSFRTDLAVSRSASFRPNGRKSRFK